MALKTLDPAVKAAFTHAGVTLTAEQEHVAADAHEKGAFPWVNLLKALGNLAATIIPILIGLFGGSTPPSPPTPAPAKGTMTCCDHHCLCFKTFEAAVHTAKLAGEHVCCCCCDGCA